MPDGTERTAETPAPKKPTYLTHAEAAGSPPKRQTKKTRQVKPYKELFEKEQRGHGAITNRVMMAVRMLKRTKGTAESAVIDAELVALAIETLEGE